MKRLTIGAFACAVMSALLLAALSQAGERVMRPEFGAGLKATKAPATVSPTPTPTPPTGPGGEEILTDKLGRIPPASTTGPGGEEIFTDEMKGTHKDTPAWLYPEDEEATTDEESGGIRFGDGIRGKSPPAGGDDKEAATKKKSGWKRFGGWILGEKPSADDGNTKSKKGGRLKGKKILEN